MLLLFISENLTFTNLLIFSLKRKLFYKTYNLRHISWLNCEMIVIIFLYERNKISINSIKHIWLKIMYKWHPLFHLFYIVSDLFKKINGCQKKDLWSSRLLKASLHNSVYMDKCFFRYIDNINKDNIYCINLFYFNRFLG